MALVAVAVLFVHALVMGWHVPPQLRALASLDTGICHAAAPEHDSPGGPASPSDHLAHCPICLTVDGGTPLGPMAGPVVAPPGLFASVAFVPVESPGIGAAPAKAFSARAPPVAV